MALVGYSDSESSDAEKESPVQPKVKRSSEKASKPSFQKLRDRSNPHKIRVNLGHGQNAMTGPEEEPEPPAKRTKLGGSFGGGFNAMLPAPKRAATTMGADQAKRTDEAGANSAGSGRALGSANSRGIIGEAISTPDDSNDFYPGRSAYGNNEAESSNVLPAGIDWAAPAEPKKVGSAMMFKPLSVARKPQKKKPTLANKPSSEASPSSLPDKSTDILKEQPKVSLFSMGGSVDKTPEAHTEAAAEYQPYFGDAKEQSKSHIEPSTLHHENENAVETVPTSSTSATSQPQSLQFLASSLNLTPAQQRQLFGRNATNKDVSVVNFNADAEYNANEELRASAAGDTKQQALNPVRAIAPGKHSLKQLVNAVAGQRDALEESFAAGKRNRAEAGSKYGW